MPEVVLHQWEISPFCGKVRQMLRHKGVPYRTVEYNGLRVRTMRRLSVAGLLPVLDWDGERIADSAKIAAFLEQRVPTPPLYPADPRDAALARRYEDWAASSLYAYGLYLRAEYAAPRAVSIALLCAGRPAWERLLFSAAYTRHVRRRVAALGFLKREGAEVEATCLRLVDDLDASLRERAWLVGEARSIADISVAAQLQEMLRTSTLADRIRRRPNVVRWLDAQAG